MSTLLTIKKNLALLTLFAFLATSAGGPAAVGTAAPVSGIAADISSAATTLANQIFRNLDIPVTPYEIEELNTTRRMGNGEIALAYSLAKSSGHPVSQIVHMRYDEKMGWGKIAKSLGVKLHSAAGQADNILRDGKMDKDADDLKNKTKSDADDDDKDDKPGKPGKGQGKNK